MLNSDPPLDELGWPKVNDDPTVAGDCGKPVTPVAGEDGALAPKANGLLVPDDAPKVNEGALVNGLLGVAEDVL